MVADVGVHASPEGQGMVESSRCRVCEEIVPGRTIPVLLPGAALRGLLPLRDLLAASGARLPTDRA